MALLTSGSVIFYHPCDDVREKTQSQDWSGTTSFTPAQVISGCTPVSFNDEFTFGSGHLFDDTTDSNADRRAIVNLDDDTVMIHSGKSRILQISGTTITFGDISDSLLTGYEYLDAEKVSFSGGSGYAFVSSRAYHLSVQTTMNLIKIIGTTITSVDKKQLIADNGPSYDQTAWSVMPVGDKVYMAALNQAMIITVSGETWSSGLTRAPAESSYPMDISPISDSGVAVIYQNGEVRIGTLDYDNDDVTYGSGYVFRAGGVASHHPNSHMFHSSVSHLGNGKILVAYRIGDGGRARLGQVNGSVVTFGDEVVFALGSAAWDSDWNTNFIETSVFDTNTALISYSHNLTNGNQYAKYRIAHVVGNNLTISDEYIWGDMNKSMPHIKTITPSSIMGVYRESPLGAVLDQTVYIGEAGEVVELTGTDLVGFNYPSTSGYDHLAMAMWVKNPSGNSSSTAIDYGYSTVIEPSSICLNDNLGVNFVGGFYHGYSGTFDQAHEGNSGQPAEYIQSNVGGFLNANPADIVLLHIGTNDVASSQNVSGIIDEIEGICYNVFNWGVSSGIDIQIILAQITNWNDPSGEYGQATTALNGLIQTLGNDLATSGYNISLVDMESALTYPDDISDNVHPNDGGYTKMADVWYAPTISGIRAVKQATGQSTVRVMPLGDSITLGLGATNDNGYRFKLQSLLANGLSGVRWNDAGIQNFLSSTKDDSNHFIVFDFESNGSGDWNLRTSLDGSSWVDQGQQNVGLQNLLVTSGIIPGLSIQDGSSQQFVDDLAVWGGTFNRFTDEQLGQLHDLGNGGSGLDQYSLLYGADINASLNLFISGPNQPTASSNLFISGPVPLAASGNLFISGPMPPTASGDLFIHGYVSTEEGESLARPIDWLLNSHDHYPQIIGTLEGAASATIQVWEITDGQNTSVSLASSGCYQIGDTGRWGWSTVNLPTGGTYQLQYFYMITADNNDIFTGQFFLKLSEKAKWIHPRNREEYLR